MSGLIGTATSASGGDEAREVGGYVSKSPSMDLVSEDTDTFDFFGFE
jgi:hypothetical protein